MPDLFVAEQPGPPGAPRVVLVHGSLDRSSAFARVARHLDGFAVVRYDRRGYGRSLAAGACRVFDDQVADLVEVVDGIPSTIVGHSLGGVVALALAQQQPALVRSVVAYESPTPWADWWPAATAGSAAVTAPGTEGDAAEAFMRRMVGDERWEALPARTRQQRRDEGPALVAELRALREPALPPYDPAAVRCPVVAAHGTGSRPHHQETARALAVAVPDGELHVVEGAGHGVHLSHPAALAGLARRAVALAEERGR